MIIEKPRALPRVAITTLALGGPAVLAGCGGSGGGDAIRAYCTQAADCAGYTGSATYINNCVNGYNNQLSYYDSACQGAIRRALACVSGSSVCDASGCIPQIQDAVGTCFDVSSATADFCGHLTACPADRYYSVYYYENITYAGYCAADTAGNEASAYAHSSACGQAYNALNTCLGNLACGASQSPCSNQFYDFNTYCYYY